MKKADKWLFKTLGKWTLGTLLLEALLVYFYGWHWEYLTFFCPQIGILAGWATVIVLESKKSH